MPEIDLMNRNNAYNYAISLANNQAFCIDYNSKLVSTLTIDEYQNIDKFLTDRIMNTEHPLLLEGNYYAF